MRASAGLSELRSWAGTATLCSAATPINLSLISAMRVSCGSLPEGSLSVYTNILR